MTDYSTSFISNNTPTHSSNNKTNNTSANISNNSNNSNNNNAAAKDNRANNDDNEDTNLSLNLNQTILTQSPNSHSLNTQYYQTSHNLYDQLNNITNDGFVNHPLHSAHSSLYKTNQLSHSPYHTNSANSNAINSWNRSFTVCNSNINSQVDNLSNISIQTQLPLSNNLFNQTSSFNTGRKNYFLILVKIIYI
jgi:hypothetical protein